jgi:hypothetical protein
MPTRNRLNASLPAILVLTLTLMGWSPAASATFILEDFEAYAVGEDTTPAFQESDAFYEIPITGNAAASVGEGLASAAGIVDLGGLHGHVWSLKARAEHYTTFDGFLLIGDMPSLLGPPTQGPIGSFFSTPQDFTNLVLQFDVTGVSALGTESVAVLIEDTSGNGLLTNPVTVTSSFQTLSVTFPDFVIEDFEEGGPFDPTQVRGIGFEFSTSLFMGSPAREFHIDNVLITPEPGTGLLLSAGLIALALHGRRQRGLP